MTQNPDRIEGKLVAINPPGLRRGNSPLQLSLLIGRCCDPWRPGPHKESPPPGPSRSVHHPHPHLSRTRVQFPDERHDGSGRSRRREAQSEDVISGFWDRQDPAARLRVPVQRLCHHRPAGPGVGPAGATAARRPSGFGPVGGGLRARGGAAGRRRRPRRVLLPWGVAAAGPRLPVQSGGAAASRSALLPAGTPAAAAGPDRQPLPAEPGGPERRVLR